MRTYRNASKLTRKKIQLFIYEEFPKIKSEELISQLIKEKFNIEVKPSSVASIVYNIKNESLGEVIARKFGSVEEEDEDDDTPTPYTRRCKNKFCIERFVPTNGQHFFCSATCQLSSEQWTTEEILSEEGSLVIGSSSDEMVKRAFAQKNQLQRKVNTLISNREWFKNLSQETHLNFPELKFEPKPYFKVEGKKSSSKKRAILICSDWQLGKLENGIGISVMIDERIPRIINATLDIIEHYRKAGNEIDELHIVFDGDIIEGCWIYRGQQLNGLDKTSESNRITKQIALAATLEAKVAVELASRVEKVFVHSIPGNHGRPNGRNEFSDPRDNFDTMVADWASDKSSLQKNLKWDIQDDWIGNFEIFPGRKVYVTHGDAWRGGTLDLIKLLPQWYTGGLLGENKPALFITAHRHDYMHFHVNGIPVIQNGTIDGGSLWYQKQYGKSSKPTQTVVVSSEKRDVEAVYPIYF